MDAVCSDSLWDDRLSWDQPVLTRCFRQSILRLAPCLLLWLLTPIDLLSKSNPLPIRASWLGFTRILLALTACIINVSEVVLLMNDPRSYKASAPIDLWTPVIVAATYLLLVSIMIRNRTKRFTRSAPCWIFLFVSNIANGLNYYQLMHPQVPHQEFEYYTGLAFLPVIFVLLIASSVTETILPDPTKPRFRKRDKILFYGRQMLRKVRTSLIPAGKTNQRKGRKRQMVLRFAKRLLRLRKEQPLSLQVKEPSQAFLEEASSEQRDTGLPKEVVYMLKGVRVFGLFDKPLFLEMCKRLEFVNVNRGQFLFSIGDPDDSIYIVHVGRMQVVIQEPDGSELALKEVTPGDTIVSLLSIMDLLSGHLSPFKSVSAKALEDSTVIRLQAYIFKELLEKHPESLVRIVQVIMVRLQRVMFTALHDYLGLTTQLVIPGPLNSPAVPTAAGPSAASLPNRKISSSFPVAGHGPGSPLKVTHPSRRISVLHQMEKQRSMTEAECRDLRANVLLESSGEHSEADNLSQSQGHAEPSTPTGTAEDTISELKTIAPDSPSKMRLTNPHIEKMKRKRSVFVHHNEERMNCMTDIELLQLAVEGFTQQMGLEDGLDTVRSKVKVQDFATGACLTEEESRDGACLFYVLSGCLVVSQKNSNNKNQDLTLYHAFPGELVGALSVITGDVSAFTIKTKGFSRLGVITENDAYLIMKQFPQTVLHLGHTVVRRLSPFVRQIDFAIDWSDYESGRAIYRQGDASDSTYIVLSGRLRSVVQRSDGKKELIGEYGRGDLVGIVELLTQRERSTTVMSVRDSELAKLPAGLLDVIKIKYPVVVTRLIQLLGHRILGSIEKVGEGLTPSDIGSRPSGSNFATVALLSITDDVPLSSFALELSHTISTAGPCLLLTSDYIRKTLGPSVLDTVAEYRLSIWLAQQEDRHRLVIYQCDSSFSNWTQRCIRQSDCILIVGLADSEPTVGKIEKQLEQLAVRTQKELVLLHRQTAERPKNTVKWLNMRSWCSSFHHIRCPKRVFHRKSPNKLRESYSDILTDAPDIHSDVARLGRFLTGTSIGLVLGGGGARGAAHVGMIKAIREAGIPIDMVGGTSIGAFMGAIWAQELDVERLRLKGRSWSFLMTSVWRQIWDLTYPVSAMFTGAGFNRTIFETFGDAQIEDLWLPYFTITTDISSSQPRVHRFGSLWRYVRASMSLSGYLPPMCDPVDGHLLLDGGYVNNLPADVMREVMGAETILAVDVGSQDDTDITNYGDELSGWWLLYKRWNPFCRKVKVPNLPEIQQRLAYVSCVGKLEEVKRADYCTYIRPPIDQFQTLQFKSFDAICDVGYNHGKVLFSVMSLQNQKSLHSYLQIERQNVYQQQGMPACKPSFVDLAEKVCRVEAPIRSYSMLSDNTDASEDEDGLDYYYHSEPEIAGSNDTGDEYSAVRFAHRKVSTVF